MHDWDIISVICCFSLGGGLVFFAAIWIIQAVSQSASQSEVVVVVGVVVVAVLAVVAVVVVGVVVVVVVVVGVVGVVGVVPLWLVVVLLVLVIGCGVAARGCSQG